MKHSAPVEIPFHPPEQVFAGLAERPGALFLDSSDPRHPLSRYSFIAYDPVEWVRPEDAAQKLASLPNLPGDLPFMGGIAGVFGYDPAASCLALYTKAIAFDLQANRSWLCGNAALPELRLLAPLPVTLSFTPVKSRVEYEQDIARVIRYILDGDIFQANLAQYFTATLPQNFDAYRHYLHLRRLNPAPFSAFMNCGDRIIVSTSPERFLHLKDSKIESRPIKGTLSDRFPAAQLAHSDKDRAENIMIVDLLRNDLSKVCTDPSVSVDELCGIETFAGLHHMVSTVSGTLRSGYTALDALNACFPGGSITGAPKLRAMDIIAELEPRPRGAYCGSIGYVTANGTMDTNIAIRTLQYKDGQAVYAAGGGITAASDPAAEYEETLLKAQKVFESFGA
jgi:para-aminobenzoate synthetase component 1